MAMQPPIDVDKIWLQLGGKLINEPKNIPDMEDIV